MTMKFAPTTPVMVALMFCGLRGPVWGADVNSPPPSLPNHQSGQTKSLPPQTGSGIQGPAGLPAAATRGAPGTSKTADAALHAAFLKLLNSPDSTVVSVNGKSISAGEFRSSIRSYASQHAKPMRRAAAKKNVPPVSTGSALTAQNNALLSEMKQRLTGNGAQLAGTTALAVKARVGVSGTAFGTPTASTTTAAGATIGKPCPQRPPSLVAVKGSLTPGGMIALEGECLGGTQGQVLMYGDFPNGSVPLQVQMWADAGAAATVPADLAGVIDQAARIQVVRADGQVSTLHNYNYVASRATALLPASLVQLVNCNGLTPADCSPATAYHMSMLSTESGWWGQSSGADSWRVTVGNDWALQTINISDLSGSTAVTGFDQGPPNFAAFGLQWLGALVSETNIRSSFMDLGVDDQTYLASYAFTITASGPTGVSPDPAVKPPYSGHAAAVGTPVRAADFPPPTVVGTTLTGAPPAALPGGNQPVWNTIIGSGAAPGATGVGRGFGSPRPSAPVRPVQVPGQPTSVQPGTPVQN